MIYFVITYYYVISHIIIIYPYHLFIYIFHLFIIIDYFAAACLYMICNQLSIYYINPIIIFVTFLFILLIFQTLTFPKSENVENDLQKASLEVIHLREEESKLRHENLQLKVSLRCIRVSSR